MERAVRTLIGIAVLGAAGALSRNAVDGWIATRVGGSFPWGTLVVNTSGSLLLGFLFTLLTERIAFDSSTRFAITTGFIGAYTTFSTFSLETVRLAQDGELWAAGANLALNVGLGFAAVYAGIVLARAIA
jgi:CrcB protein